MYGHALEEVVHGLGTVPGLGNGNSHIVAGMSGNALLLASRIHLAYGPGDTSMRLGLHPFKKTAIQDFLNANSSPNGSEDIRSVLTRKHVMSAWYGWYQIIISARKCLVWSESQIWDAVGTWLVPDFWGQKKSCIWSEDLLVPRLFPVVVMLFLVRNAIRRGAIRRDMITRRPRNQSETSPESEEGAIAHNSQTILGCPR